MIIFTKTGSGRTQGKLKSRDAFWARLQVHRVRTNLSSGELITLAEAPAGTSGA
jgi:hypothetical protein